MANSDTGKILALIGGLIGCVIAIIAVIPDMQALGWWQLFGDNIPFLGDEYGYINIFGYSSNTFNDEVEFIEEGTMIFLGGIIFLLCSILIILTAAKEEKTYSLLCAIGMIAGIFVFCYGLSSNPNLSDTLNLTEDFFGGEGNIFFGSAVIFGVDTTWRIGNGFIIGSVATLCALIGSVIMD